jgi:hypothetical protein
VTILGVRAAETLLGYAVLKVTSVGDTGYVLDLVTHPGHHDVARALLRQAVRHFRRLYAYTVSGTDLPKHAPRPDSCGPSCRQKKRRRDRRQSRIIGSGGVRPK